MKVKICGIRTVETALHAVQCGTDALGFVFARSKRQIMAQEAKNIIETIPEHIWKVGVFVNEDSAEIKRIAESVGLTHIQLHGDEVPADYQSIGLPIIKAVSVHSPKDLEKIDAIEADYILLDSPPTEYRGGNGSSFEWNLVKAIGKSKKNIMLAGGLDPENISKAIAKVNPCMVDVSSGVETNGEKDLTKIKDFITNAKNPGEEEDYDNKNL
ncbi:phosphoribosylanthranilate isomerase [Bacillus sp. ISL-35]|uniref:phosphoribosylanthranilate isomerase n=1 Tax=Bacillus sp. ISL-35 TaxID=2819122 RepID=UPI001BE976DA|nr:phosphoribosylanthranilate isomerase [Bacillus sp. ISL-35]MBT2677909.1 phosphoribosylanthranilate isomerase [Bacillus sp. ISL-35]MBT2704952.1 phosphoribosylanthranilate isomerase [Chryseobacterium sp. ISL-80]